MKLVSGMHNTGEGNERSALQKEIEELAIY